MSVQPSQACHGFSFKKGSIKILINDVLVEHCTQRSQQDLFELNLENNNHSIEHVFLLADRMRPLGRHFFLNTRYDSWVLFSVFFIWLREQIALNKRRKQWKGELEN